MPTHFRDIMVHDGTVYGEMLAPTLEDTFVVCLEIGLEVSADKTKYMVMSRDLNAG